MEHVIILLKKGDSYIEVSREEDLSVAKKNLKNSEWLKNLLTEHNITEADIIFVHPKSQYKVRPVTIYEVINEGQ